MLRARGSFARRASGRVTRATGGPRGSDGRLMFMPQAPWQTEEGGQPGPRPLLSQDHPHIGPFILLESPCVHIPRDIHKKTTQH